MDISKGYQKPRCLWNY